MKKSLLLLSILILLVSSISAYTYPQVYPTTTMTYPTTTTMPPNPSEYNPTTLPPTTSTCGDKICNNGETSTTCSADCSSNPSDTTNPEQPETTSPTTSEAIPSSSITTTPPPTETKYVAFLKEIVQELRKPDNTKKFQEIVKEKEMKNLNIPHTSLKELKSDCLYNQGAYSCGPNALLKTLSEFGIESSREEIDKFRKDGGGFLRSTFSLFNKDAKQITWPSEMKKTLESYGLKVEEINGGNKIEKADKILAEQKDVVIITRVSEGSLFSQHWTIYEGNGEYYDFYGKKALVGKNEIIYGNIKIKTFEMFVVTKPKTN